MNDISDVFLFLKIIGGGDELQGIKRGVMEMVDLIFINKVHEDNLQKAKSTKVELKRALQFLPSKEMDWAVPIILGSALENTGLEEVYQNIDEFISFKKEKGSFEICRKQQAEKRFAYWVKEFILQKTQQQSENQSYEQHLKNVAELNANPISEAKEFVNKLFG